MVRQGVPESPVAWGTKMQYRVAIHMDYKKTTRFSVDSVGVFYWTSKYTERVVSPVTLYQKGTSVFYTAPDETVLAIYDPAGKLVKRLTMEPGQDRKIDMRLRPGVYFLEMKTGDKGLRLKALIL